MYNPVTIPAVEGVGRSIDHRGRKKIYLTLHVMIRHLETRLTKINRHESIHTRLATSAENIISKFCNDHPMQCAFLA